MDRRSDRESNGSGSPSSVIVRAAEYVRMSTDHQKYSTENQAEAIRQYAAKRGIEIVRTYADEGKSGLRLDGRDALKRLIDEVQSGATDYTTILAEEIEIVRWIYRSFVSEKKTETEIAEALNQRRVVTDLGRPWTRGTVHQILINEKYIGNNVWNHASFKLKRKRIHNLPNMWIRADEAFKAIVDRTTFDAAQAIIRVRSLRLSDEEMLKLLQDLLQERGYLSGLLIDESESLPSSSAYQSRFRSLLRAYKLVGFTPDRDYRYVEINRTLRRMHPQIVADTIVGIHQAGGLVEQDPENDLLTINREFTTSVVVVRCLTTPTGSRRWKIRFDVGLWPDITVAVHMDEPNQNALDYYLLPRINMTAPNVRLPERL